MAETGQRGRPNIAPVRTELVWEGKYDEQGRPRPVERIALPFQTIEVINEPRARTLFTRSRGEGDGWRNKLIWGDNKYVMASLREEFAGKIDLIYIDPPFATGADFSINMKVGDAEWTKEASIIEEKAYRDTWGSGLKFISPDAHTASGADERPPRRYRLNLRSPRLACRALCEIIMHEIFKKENFRNEIVWCYTGPSRKVQDFPDKHELILRYSKTEQRTLNLDAVKIPYSESFLKRRQYTEGTGGIYGGRERPNEVVEDYKRGKVPEDWWSDIPTGGQIPVTELLGFPTQKPEKLLDRIVKASSNEGDLVADFFCGSGTTMAVAEKLGRRWIGCDLSRFAIQVSRKRLLDIPDCQPFEVLNLGKYERQYWQMNIMNGRQKEAQRAIFEYLDFIVKLYQAQPVIGFAHLHGRKAGRMVHVGAVDAPVTFAEVRAALEECQANGLKALDVLGWEWEMGLNDLVKNEAANMGIDLRLLIIPREVMDKRAVEAGDVHFYELAHLELEVKQNKRAVAIILKNFAIPSPELIPPEVRDKIKRWSDYMDFWAVDWHYKDDTFRNQ